jgi:hypothetical protein
MPLVIPANDFYDVIHTSPLEQSRAILMGVASTIDGFHRRTAQPDAGPEAVRSYLEAKAVRNARTILDFARLALPGTRFRLNGREHSLESWECLQDMTWLEAQVGDRRTSRVHGDLTIENIIVAPEQGPGWYLIDPNPENGFDSPLIDWAKLMQSLHLGYEGLNRHFSCSLTGDEIRLSFTRSAAYTELHGALETLIACHCGADALREVYFHELVNYLRLTPYKIRQNPQKGLCFFACTSLLLDRYLGAAR